LAGRRRIVVAGSVWTAAPFAADDGSRGGHASRASRAAGPRHTRPAAGHSARSSTGSRVACTAARAARGAAIRTWRRRISASARDEPEPKDKQCDRGRIHHRCHPSEICDASDIVVSRSAYTSFHVEPARMCAPRALAHAARPTRHRVSSDTLWRGITGQPVRARKQPVRARNREE